MRGSPKDSAPEWASGDASRLKWNVALDTAAEASPLPVRFALQPV